MLTILLSPTHPRVGLTSVCLGLIHALDQKGLRIAAFKAVGRDEPTEQDRSIQLIRKYTSLNPPPPIAASHARNLLHQNQQGLLLEEVISLRQTALTNNSKNTSDYDVLIVEGFTTIDHDPAFSHFNISLARALDARVILVTTPQANTLEEINGRLESSATLFGGVNDNRVLGCIVNMLNAPLDRNGRIRPDILHPTFNTAFGLPTLTKNLPVLQRPDFHLIGAIPWHINMTAPRTYDIANFLQADILVQGDIKNRRITHVVLGSQHVHNTLNTLLPGTLIICPGDRSDIILTCCFAQLKGIPLAGLLLTDPIKPDALDTLLDFCQPAIQKGLPILILKQDGYQLINQLPDFENTLPTDDPTRVHFIKETIAQNLDKNWLANIIASPREPKISPAAFRYSLLQKARRQQMKIILPEGNEPRTIQAAVNCYHRNIAQCILMGSPDMISKVAKANGIHLPKALIILNPEPLREQYISTLLELRHHKGLTEERARQELEDNVVLGTIMLYLDEVDGLVSGAVHTTANTIRPALQLIRSKPDVNIVSSVFFMCLPDQVQIFGDCAINPDPNAEQLADIAIESAGSAVAFGINPKVAMISYSTLGSGSGSDVEKVKQATLIAKNKIVQSNATNIVIDGPLQFDAAIIKQVAQKKAPNSPVAGQANVLIFPDLNTGNTTYKAVQRSANLVSIGPMLQGLNKPVNDLSRGASIDDIVYTIALTSIQAQQIKYGCTEAGTELL